MKMFSARHLVLVALVLATALPVPVPAPAHAADNVFAQLLESTTSWLQSLEWWEEECGLRRC